MKHLKIGFKILLLANLLITPAAKADVLIPGSAPVSYCFGIANIDKYPNHYLIAQIKSQNPSIPAYNRILKSKQCLGLNGYREYSEIYAVKKADINSTDIITDKQGQQLKNFDTKKSKLIPAKKTIQSLRTIPEKYGVTAVADILEITAIAPKSLDLKNKEVVYTYKNKTTERKAYQNQEQRPEPSTKTTSYLFILPIFGLTLIGGFIAFKKSRFARKS